MHILKTGRNCWHLVLAGCAAPLIDAAAYLERDVIGECDDCKDRVKRAEEERQKELEKTKADNPDEYPEAPGAKSRIESPGSMGGKD